MAFTAPGEKVWPVPPDWSAGVQESLAWSTDVMRADATGACQHRLLSGPRRMFGFEVLASGQDRRVADMLLAGHSGLWELPVWPDVQWLLAPLAAAAEEIPCQTAGFDFTEGGLALLYASVNAWEIVEIDAIEADHLALVDPTASAYPRGARLYPLRTARVLPGTSERLGNDNTSRRGVAFEITEPCDWPELVAPTTYLDHLVLDRRPDESEDPTAGYERLLQAVDYETGQPFTHDLAGVALRQQQNRWQLFGREQHSWFRSLLYTLGGRHRPIWVPTFNSDLRAAAAVGAGSTSLSVEWAGYTLFGLGKNNRKDIAVELLDGSVLYRRITAAVEAGATETLTLSAALDVGSIAPGQIRSISFMALSTLASDELELEHQTDAGGLARTGTAWQAVVSDV